MDGVRGFTLIELVMVMLIASILSVFAIAKIGYFSGWEAAGTAQSVASHLFSAQRLAIANRTTVHVLVAPASIRACYDAACASPCANLDGTPLSLVAPSGSFTATSSSFNFDAEGRPSFTGAYTIAYGTVTVHVEPETGLIW